MPTDTVGAEVVIPEVSGSPLELFDRWEEQQWSVTHFDFAADRPGWQTLRGLVRQELRDAIESFLIGEHAVTETLAPLVYAAPTTDAQLFMSTQLVDEARHTLLFARYLAAVENTQDVTFVVPTADSLNDMLNGALREATSRVRETPQDNAAWYRATVVYHLLIEGVLAVSGIRSLLGALRELDELPVLARAVTNVARDESRHIGFGVGALRAGVASGHGDTVTQALHDFVPSTARALVNPDRTYPRLLPEPTVQRIASALLRLWGLAEGALLRRVELIGLGGDTPEMVRTVWARGRDDALSEYQARHSSPHPIRRAAARLQPAEAQT